MKAAKIQLFPKPMKVAMIGTPTGMARIAGRGWAPVYYPAETNRCPSCSGTQWRVGRVTAECAHCDLPLLIRVTGEDQK